MARYEIKNEFGMEVCTGILRLFYGNLWEAALDRLNHRQDGYLRSLYHQDHEYRVYRRFPALEIVPAAIPGKSANPLTAARVG